MTKRTLTLTLTLQAVAELDTDEAAGQTHVSLQDVRHAVIGTLQTPLKIDEDPLHTSEEFRRVMATEVTKLAVNYLQHRLSGQHADPVPEVNQPGALA